MSAVFKDRTIHKYYQCVVHGQVTERQVITGYLSKDDAGNQVTIYQQDGPGRLPIVTEYEPLEHSGEYTLLKVTLITGRTHQIRAHLEAAGYPIVGDKLYGRDKTAFLDFIRHGFTSEMEKRLLLPRSALHAARLVFLHPQNKKKMIVRAPLPKMFADFIRAQKNRKDL